MEKQSLNTALALSALILFALSIPLSSWASPQLGAMLRWTGLAAGLAYLFVRDHNHSSQKTG